MALTPVPCAAVLETVVVIHLAEGLGRAPQVATVGVCISVRVRPGQVQLAVTWSLPLEHNLLYFKLVSKLAFVALKLKARGLLEFAASRNN